MKRLALALLFGVSACAHRMPGGKAVITSSFRGTPLLEERVFWNNAGDVRHEFVTAAGEVASVILDRHDAAATVGIWPDKREFLPLRACPPVDKLAVEELGRRVIAGYDCRSLRVRTQGRTFDVCLAEKIPISLRSFGGALQQLRDEGYLGFPLETRDRSERDVAGDITVEERLNDVTLFNVPADYKRMIGELPPCPKNTQSKPAVGPTAYLLPRLTAPLM